MEKLGTPDEEGRTWRLTVELQENFALNQPLSPFALAALTLLDREDPGYALDVVSVIEATLEKPRQVLNMQEKKARGEAVASMKAEGLDYDERMKELEDVSYPKPLEELLSQAFETYRTGAPWVAQFELTPKSVVRDMYERAMGFTDYVGFYGLARSEMTKMNIKGVFQIWMRDGSYHEINLKECHAWTREGCTHCPDFAAEHADIMAEPGFGKHFTDHMVTIRYSEGKGWYDARVEARAPIPMDPATAVLHYAQEIFEGMKAYRRADGSVWTFRPDQNAKRMQRSAARPKCCS